MVAANDAITAGIRAQLLVSGGTVTVVRGDQTALFKALPGKVRTHELSFRERDFIFELAACDVGRPEPGDLWTFEGTQYEVRPFEGEVPWTTSGHEAWLRVPTKEAAWSRDTLTFEQPRKPQEAGDQRPEDDSLPPVTGLIKAVSGSEAMQADFQQIGFTDYRAIVRSTPATRSLRPQDRFTFTLEGQCRTANLTAVRDPGTNGSVLYLECREQLN